MKNYTSNESAADVRKSLSVLEDLILDIHPWRMFRFLENCTYGHAETRPGDWCMEYQLLGVSVYMPLKSKRLTLKRPENLHLYQFSVAGWLAMLPGLAIYHVIIRLRYWLDCLRLRRRRWVRGDYG